MIFPLFLTILPHRYSQSLNRSFYTKKPHNSFFPEVMQNSKNPFFNLSPQKIIVFPSVLPKRLLSLILHRFLISAYFTQLR